MNIEETKFSNLRRTNTAIHCPTELLAQGVHSILKNNKYVYAYNSQEVRWDLNGGKTHFYLHDSNLTRDNGDYARNSNSTIISAEDFIRANTEESLYQIFN